jgi:hypothetical protein
VFRLLNGHFGLARVGLQSALRSAPRVKAGMSVSAACEPQEIMFVSDCKSRR